MAVSENIKSVAIDNTTKNPGSSARGAIIRKRAIGITLAVLNDRSIRSIHTKFFRE